MPDRCDDLRLQMREAISQGGADGVRRLENLLSAEEDRPDNECYQTVDSLRANLDSLRENVLNEARTARQQLEAMRDEPNIQPVLFDDNRRDDPEDWTDVYLQEIDRQVAAWWDETQRWFDKWSRNLLSDDKPLVYRDLESDISRVGRERGRQMFIDGIVEYCRQKLGQARETVNNPESTVDPITLRETFLEPTQRVVSRASGIYRSEPRLMELESEITREIQVLEQSVVIFMTAQQSDLYADNIRRLQTFPEDARVPIVDYFRKDDGTWGEQFQKYGTKEEAVESLQEKARDFAANKSREYYDEAQSAYEQYQLERAEQEISKAFSNINEFLDREWRDDFNKLSELVNERKKARERAETLIKRATEVNLDDSHDAYRLYREATRIYPPLIQQEIVRQEILSRLLRELGEVKDSLNAAYRNRDWKGIAETIVQVDPFRQAAYAEETDIQELLEEIDAIQQQADDFERDVQKLRSELQQLTQDYLLIDKQHERLRELEETYSRAVLDEVTAFAEAQARVRRELGFKAVSDEVQELLSSTDERRIERVLRDLKERAQTDTEIKAIYEDLKLHQDYLEAKASFDLHLFDRSREKLQAIRQKRTHPDFEKANDLWNEIEKTQEDQQEQTVTYKERKTTVTSLLDTSPDLVNAKDLEEAVRLYKELVALNRLPDDTQAEWRELRQRLQQKAKRSIEKELDSFDVSDESLSVSETDGERVSKLIEYLNDLDLTDEASQYAEQTKPKLDIINLEKRTQRVVGNPQIINQFTDLHSLIHEWENLKRRSGTRNRDHLDTIHDRLRMLRAGYHWLRVRLASEEDAPGQLTELINELEGSNMQFSDTTMRGDENHAASSGD